MVIIKVKKQTERTVAMKKFNFKQAVSKPKTVYIMAGVSFLVTAIAIGIIYSKTMNTLEKNLPQSSTTQQVNQVQSGEEDPRKVTRVTTTIPPSTAVGEEITLPPATTVPVTEDAVATTAAPEKQPETTKASQTDFIMPHDGEIIRAYSPDVPLYCETMNDWRTHHGIDIAVGEGEDVLSVGKGKVSKVVADSTYGYTVEVDYGTFTARYCGMKQGDCVGIGQVLEKGDSIGTVDVVPCEVNSPKHLHFEVVIDGDNDDPLKVLG